MKSSSAVCSSCHSPFIYMQKTTPRTFCSLACRRREKNRARSKGLRGPAEANCKQCGQRFEYERQAKERLYCSDSCSWKSDNARRAPNKALPLGADCVVCGQHFTYPWTTARRKTCSEPCRLKRKEWIYAQYQIATAAEKRANTRRWYRANAEHAKAYQREYEKRNKSRVRQYQQQWTAANRGRVRAKKRAWELRNPMAVRLNRHRRRARIRAVATVPFTKDELVQRFSMWRGCWICDASTQIHIDHVKPIAKGGAHMLANLRPICPPCNWRKSDIWPLTPEVLRKLQLAAAIQ